MQHTMFIAAVLFVATAGIAHAQDDQAQALVARLDLERYKATIKGLTQFGDRRQGTSRNRNAVDWIEAQLRSHGCATERMQYEYKTPPRPGGLAAAWHHAPHRGEQ